MTDEPRYMGEEVDDVADAWVYLSNVLKAVAPEVEPLPDLMGLCTQIDNLIAGLVEANRATKV
jgi:hypothetical protein